MIDPEVFYRAVVQNDIESVRHHMRHVDKQILKNAFAFAIERGREEVCKVLLDDGADPRYMTVSGKITDLMRRVCSPEQIREVERFLLVESIMDD